MSEEYDVKPRPVTRVTAGSSRIVAKTAPDETVAPTVKNDDLKAKLLAVLQEDPGTVEVDENAWLHDVFVRKIKALVE